MILDKSFSPLDRFMNKDDYLMVLSDMRLQLVNYFQFLLHWMLIRNFQKVNIGEKIILREKEGFKIATMVVESIWEPNLHLESELVYGTTDLAHPAVNYMFNTGNKVYIGGKIQKISMPNHYDYRQYEIRPDEVKIKLKIRLG